MVKNYFKLAFRNLVKRRGYSLLNIFGLALGISCCLLIFQYVAFERSFDKFQTKSDQIVRLRLDSYHAGELQWKSATSYPAFGPTMKRDFPEVENFCRLHDADLVLSNEERNIKFKEEKGYFADSSFLSMFNIELLEGNSGNALNGPDKLLLSEKTAKKYFGNAEALGKKLVYREPPYSRIFEVTGIFREFPANSHLIINHLVSYVTLGSMARQDGDTSNSTETSFGWYDFYTYLQFKPGTDLKKFEDKLPPYCDRYMNKKEWAKTNKIHTEIHIILLSDIHLYSNYNQEAEANGNGLSVAFLFMIAFFIIGIAWVNYINLSTARSVERAREVGVRKVLGAVRKNLIGQFLTESLILNLVAFVFTFGIVLLLTPWFNQLTGNNMHSGFHLPLNYWLGFAGLFVSGSFLSGIYPALFLSSFQPVIVLKGLFSAASSRINFRKVLVVVQFSISIILIIGTVIVFQQLRFIQNTPLGFDKDQVATMTYAFNDEMQYNSFRNELLQTPSIKDMARSSRIPSTP
jgi:putative ABC transport system permease protein